MPTCSVTLRSSRGDRGAQGASRFVTVGVCPGARKGERMVVSLDDFNLLAGRA